MFIAVDSKDLIQQAKKEGIKVTISPDTHHTWAQRSNGDERDGRGRAGTFVCTFCGQERERLADKGLSCSEQFKKNLEKEKSNED